MKKILEWKTEFFEREKNKPIILLIIILSFTVLFTLKSIDMVEKISYSIFVFYAAFVIFCVLYFCRIVEKLYNNQTKNLFLIFFVFILYLLVLIDITLYKLNVLTASIISIIFIGIFIYYFIEKLNILEFKHRIFLLISIIYFLVFKYTDIKEFEIIVFIFELIKDFIFL